LTGRAESPKPRRFLVVDDDAIFRARLVKAIVARGFEAHGAGSGEEAIELARNVQPQAAVIDLRMPGMSGLDLVRELVINHPTMQIVVLTGYGSIATAVEAVRRGAMNYLQKPLDADQILAAFDKEQEGVDAAPPERSACTAAPCSASWPSSRRWSEGIRLFKRQ
jgi:two-component system, response regulator RegA